MSIYIVTPSFNASDTIDRTILSILSQAGDFDLHYHIQDGGSTDGTVEKLSAWERRIREEWGDALCRSFTFSFAVEADAGMYDAIVKGLARFDMQDSDWIGWINADDVLMGAALPLLNKLDHSTKELPVVDWVCGAAAISIEGLQTAQSERILCREVISQGLCDGRHWGYVQQEGTFFRYHAWLAIGGKDSFGGLRYAGDWNLWRKLAEKFQIYQYKFPLGMFSIRPGQLSQIARSQYEAELDAIVSYDERTKRLYDFNAAKTEAYYLRTTGVGTTKIIVEKKGVKNNWDHWIGKQVLVDSGSDNKISDSARATEVFPMSSDRSYTAPKSISTKIYRNGSLVTYDAEWQFPAITEQHAFKRVVQLVDNSSNIVYFAFPWATLIDLLNGKKSDAERLKAILRECVQLIKPGEKVVTVCQHILMLNYQNMFAEAGITHVFWTHAIKEMGSFPKHSKIQIHPFPLYPVQILGEMVDGSHDRSLLFSFVGARANKWYLTQSRSFILDALKDDKRGFVTGRDTWHYNKAVYDHQINKKDIPAHELVDKDATEEFKQVLRDSIFSLCPSGSGPNSIRLWESIGAGSIPVILADTYLPPGDPALWEEAAVFCPETLEDINALPDRLEAIAKDPALLARKRHAMKQLWMMYGPDSFIYDIQKLYLALQGDQNSLLSASSILSIEPLLTLAKIITSRKEIRVEDLGVFILGCSSRAMTDPGAFVLNYKSDTILREALGLAMTHCSDKHRKSFGAVLAARGIVLD